MGYYDHPKIALSDWQGTMGVDSWSLSHDPLFADPDHDDFHLRSVQGRYTLSGAWTNDAEHSPCIDTGPAFAFGSVSNEPNPNGGCINLGAYGNTVQASMASTNGRVLAVSQNDGGLYRSPVTLRWLADGAVCVSDAGIFNNGVDWTLIAAGLNPNLRN